MITMTKSTFTKRKAQMKSSSYYLFWGIATVAVVSGQVYVGTGYRVLHGSVQELLQQVDGVLLHKSDDPSYDPSYGFLSND